MVAFSGMLLWLLAPLPPSKGSALFMSARKPLVGVHLRPRPLIILFLPGVEPPEWPTSSRSTALVNSL